LFPRDDAVLANMVTTLPVTTSTTVTITVSGVE
jgi:hypothetical protein